MQEFDAIRPYLDDEVQDVIQRLLADNEFVDMIGQFKAPTMSRFLSPLVRALTRRWLSSRFGKVSDVDDLQSNLAPYVAELMSNTTAAITQSGLDSLSPDGTYLFLCNHRDIVFDPLVVNHLLFHNGFKTTRIAIGDNLLENRVFAEMMRLNKSFIVKRNVKSPREMRDTYLTLSGFINHSIASGESVWIAQREGRAKDGNDFTDPAIIKMFFMSQKKAGLSFAEAMNRLHIVPVSIAYELDPCDVLKARELEARSRVGSYTKAPGEDTAQILKGLTENKGSVHVHFGNPITNAEDDPRALASRIDHDMHGYYHLQPTNLAAFQKQSGRALPQSVFDDGVNSQKVQQAEFILEQRLADCSESQRPFLLSMYANPVLRWLEANGF